MVQEWPKGTQQRVQKEGRRGSREEWTIGGGLNVTDSKDCDLMFKAFGAYTHEWSLWSLGFDL